MTSTLSAATKALTVAWMVTLAIVPGRAALQAQSTPRRFDVASMKPALSIDERIALAARDGGPPPTIFDIRTLPGGRFIATRVTLQMLLTYAFDVKTYQLEGGPKWMTTDYVDITAVADANATPADVRAMVKTLLVDRFKLRAHGDTREAPVHVLTVARSDGRLGPDLKRTTPDCERQLEARKNGSAPPAPASRTIEFQTTTPTCGGGRMMATPTGGFRAVFGGTEVTRLISLISSAVEGPVIDRTGLSGLIDYTLEYMPDRPTARSLTAQTNNDTPPPPLAVALQQQLGLKLQKQTGPLPVIVIESADHPTPD
jgi:uncharacterized protein (TIGR03435 family)